MISSIAGLAGLYFGPGNNSLVNSQGISYLQQAMIGQMSGLAGLSYGGRYYHPTEDKMRDELNEYLKDWDK